MADAARKEKLAAAKKKLKNFQRSGHPSPAPTNRNRSTPPTNSNTATNDKASTNNKASSNDKGSTNDKASTRKQTAKQKHQNGSGSSTPPQTTFQVPKTSTQKPDDSPNTRSFPGPKTSTPKSKEGNNTAIGQSPQIPAVTTAQTFSNNSPHRPITSSTHQTPGTTTSTTTESTERIHQLSMQLNGLINESSALVNNSSVAPQNGNLDALESRNRELASLVEKHMKANEQLTQQLSDVKHVNTKLQTSFDSEKRGFEDKLKRELGALKEQLQVHIQTIGILVAEKTELQSSLNQSSKVADQRAEEVEELSGRLKASRQRVADLERSFSTAASGKQKHEQSTKELKKKKVPTATLR